MRDNLSSFSSVSVKVFSQEKKKKRVKWRVIYNNYTWQTIGVGVGSFIID